MALVTVQVYHSSGADRERSRVLVETRRIDTGSDKPLTARRAGQVIAREYPAHARVGRPMVIRTEDGWRATRSLRPTAKCDYHYVWEEVILREG
jgi:hypothetical protein